MIVNSVVPIVIGATFLGTIVSAAYFHWSQDDRFVRFDQCGNNGPSYVNRDMVVALTTQEDLYGTAIWTINRDKPVLFVCGNLAYVAAELGFGPPVRSLTDEEMADFEKGMSESTQEFLRELQDEFPHRREGQEESD